jgi:hypothetical protein
VGLLSANVFESSVTFSGVRDYATSGDEDRPIVAYVAFSELASLDLGAPPLALLIPLAGARLLGLLRREPRYVEPVATVLSLAGAALLPDDCDAANFRMRDVVATDSETLGREAFGLDRERERAPREAQIGEFDLLAQEIYEARAEHPNVFAHWKQTHPEAIERAEERAHANRRGGGQTNRRGGTSAAAIDGIEGGGAGRSSMQGSDLSVAEVRGSIPVVEPESDLPVERRTQIRLLARRSNRRSRVNFKFPMRSANPLVTICALFATIEQAARRESFRDVTQPAAAGLVMLARMSERFSGHAGFDLAEEAQACDLLTRMLVEAEPVGIAIAALMPEKSLSETTPSSLDHLSDDEIREAAERLGWKPEGDGGT